VKTSPETNEISAALAKAQGVMNNPGKGAKNPHFKSNYADLSSGINAIREGLSANGIAVIQAPRLEGDVMMLDTRLTHGSDQYFESEWPICKLPAPPQQIGSALTYARRYALFAMVGIAGEDDDGNAANASATPAPPVPGPLTDEQINHLYDLIRRAKPNLVSFLDFFGLIGPTPEEFVNADPKMRRKEFLTDWAATTNETDSLALVAHLNPGRFNEAVGFLNQKLELAAKKEASK